MNDASHHPMRSVQTFGYWSLDHGLSQALTEDIPPVNLVKVSGQKLDSLGQTIFCSPLCIVLFILFFFFYYFYFR